MSLQNMVLSCMLMGTSIKFNIFFLQSVLVTFPPLETTLPGLQCGLYY